MQLPHFLAFLVCLASLWKSSHPATLRILKAAYGKETVHDIVIDPKRYAQMGGNLTVQEKQWVNLCLEPKGSSPLFQSLLCPLQHILIAEYRNRKSHLYPNVEAALERIIDSKGHYCHHLPVHSPLGIADQENRIIKTQRDMDTMSCIVMHTHEKHLIAGCALGATEERSHFHVLPTTDQASLKEFDVLSLPTQPIAPLEPSKKECRLYTFTYADQMVIQDRICCRVERCVTIYYDQPGSDPWPLIRHVVPPEWLGFKCASDEVITEKPKHYVVHAGRKVENSAYEVKAEPIEEDTQFPLTIALIGLVFVLAILVVFVGFCVWLEATS